MELLDGRGRSRLRHLILGPGMLLKGFWPGRGTTRAALDARIGAALAAREGLLGACRDTVFEVKQTFAEVRLAGQRGPMAGTAVPVWTEASLSGVLREVSPENLCALLGMVPAPRGAADSRLRLPLHGPDTGMDCLCWIGDRADGGRMVIGLRRPFPAGSLRMAFDGNGCAELPFRFVARDAPDGPEAGGGDAPFTVWQTGAAETRTAGDAPAERTGDGRAGR